jgi:hypothetical protein
MVSYFYLMIASDLYLPTAAVAGRQRSSNPFHRPSVMPARVSSRAGRAKSRVPNLAPISSSCCRDRVGGFAAKCIPHGSRINC